MKQIVLLFLLVSLALIVFLLTPASHYLGPEGIGELQSWVAKQGVLAPLVFGGLYAAATVLAFPGSLLTISGGLLFGTGWGTVINLVSATLGAMAGFLIARYFGREMVTKLIRRRTTLAEFDAKVEKHGFNAVLYLRLIPLFPFNALNYALGLTKVSFRNYALATFIGMAPGAFVYTSFGAAGRHIHLTDWHTLTNYRVWGPFVLVILLTVVTRVIMRNRRLSSH